MPGNAPPEELLNPRFDLIEGHFSHPLPEPLRRLYADQNELSRTGFTVTTRSRFVSKLANLWSFLLRTVTSGRSGGRSRSQWFVESYTPLNENSLKFFEGFERFIEFADDGSEGLYFIDPTERDPEVFLFVMDGYDLIPVGCTLSRFLRARRHEGEPDEDEHEY